VKKDFLLGILFFGSLWGVSEAGLGGFLYGNKIDYASVPLTVIAFAILTIAKLYLPQRGSAIFIGSVAMCYKFLNTPFFGCHLLAIFLLGVSYDLVFDFFKIKSRALSGAVASYVGYILFALTITYVFRYKYWINEAPFKMLHYIGIKGTLSAVINTVSVPICFNLGRLFKDGTINPFEFKSKLATGSVSLITLFIWCLGLARCF